MAIDWQEIRQRFVPFDGHYLDGNSLGLCTKASAEQAKLVLHEWQTLGIGGWFGADPPWLRMSREGGALCAPIVGAEPSRVIATGSTTANLHQGLATFYKPTPQRDRIVIDDGCFPTDGYAVQSHLRMRGLPSSALERVPMRGDLFEEEDLIAAIESDGVALAVLPVVVFSTGQLIDVERVQSAATAAGVTVLWDASHAAGSVPMRLDDWGCEYAFWCGYKYLNGGPGCVAFAYLREALEPGMAGWFGSSDEALFDMPSELRPADGAARLQQGTPHMLSLAPLLGSLSGFPAIGEVRQRSLELTGHLLDRLDDTLAAHGFGTATPRDPSRRGGHVSLRHPDAERLVHALAKMNIVTDYRRPDLIRVAPVALYNDEPDVDAVVEALVKLTSKPTASAVGRRA